MVNTFSKTVAIICIALIAGLFTMAVVPNTVHAQATTDKFEVGKYLKIDNGQTYLDTDKGTQTITKKTAIIYFITRLITILTTIIGSFALLFIIVGGITLMISHGNSNLQTKGKQMILYSIIGLLVAFSSLIIVSFVQSLFFTT